MDFLYVKALTLSTELAAKRSAFFNRAEVVEGLRLTQVTLAEFANWYVTGLRESNLKQYDLAIVECSLDRLGEELKQSFVRGDLSDSKCWEAVITEDAMGTVLRAPNWYNCLIFVHSGGIPDLEITRRLVGATTMSFDELSTPRRLETFVHRIDSGWSAFPGVTTVVSNANGFSIRDVSHSTSTLLSENFGGRNQDLDQYVHQWILNTEDTIFDCRPAAVRTLSHVFRYAKETERRQREGTPLLFQAAIVPTDWWTANAQHFTYLIRNSDLPLRITAREYPRIDDLSQISNGLSTIFIFTEDGFLRTLVDLGDVETGVRLRLDLIRSRIPGYILGRDELGQIWLHSQGQEFPLIHSRQEWGSYGGFPYSPVLNVQERLLKKGWTDRQVALIGRIIEEISYQQLGSFLIFDHDPERICVTLNSGSLSSDPQYLLNLPIDVCSLGISTWTWVLSLDGAHLFDFSGRLRYARQHLTISEKSVSPKGGGTKHTTARALASRFPDALVVAISSDGPITAHIEGWTCKSLSPKTR